MILIYAYINKFKNYTTQEIIFDPRWQINFSNKKLSIQYRGQSSASAVIRGDRKLDNLHILVGKTGSGKTNLLQMIGAKHDVRYHRKWEGEDDSYFLLYSIPHVSSSPHFSCFVIYIPSVINDNTAISP